MPLKTGSGSKVKPQQCKGLEEEVSWRSSRNSQGAVLMACSEGAGSKERCQNISGCLKLGKNFGLYWGMSHPWRVLNYGERASDFCLCLLC